MILVVTGSNGLIGSEVCCYFGARGWVIHGLDNNQRAEFFGVEGDTRWNQHRLQETIPNFNHHELDIRDRSGILKLYEEVHPNATVHAAAQPSHDRAAQIPFDDFDTNAVGTLNLLEAARQYAPSSPFIYLSTNKVYGDAPNRICLTEAATRWKIADPIFVNGIPETFTIDQSKHSLFGASKLAADVMVQEYGRYFEMPTCCLRGGCLTGPSHSGVELHGFLSYLVKCNIEQRVYRVYGYKGKQVRDNVHSFDVARFIDDYISKPRIAEVYNLGGGLQNACSILEAFDIISSITKYKMEYEYIDKNREGDHICYYSDLSKMRAHYPTWDVSVTLEQVFNEIANGWQARLR
jgi:CDP-paratose 2-epimerase